MCEEQIFNYSDLNFDFLELTPPQSDKSTQLLKSTVQETILFANHSTQFVSRNETQKRQKLAKRIANVDNLVLQLQQLETRNAQLQQQLRDLQCSADEVRTLYEQEKRLCSNLESKVRQLEGKCDALDADLTSKTFHYDQLQAQWNANKGPIEYSKLAVHYLRLTQKLDEEHTLHWHDQLTVSEITKYCEENHLRVPQAKSPKKRVRHSKVPDSKIDKGSQCSLWKSGSSEKACVDKKETRSQSTQYDCISTQSQSVQTDVVSSCSRSTQYISTTTTRSTSTACYIKQHHVGTNFPEPKSSPSVHDMLQEFCKWTCITPVTPLPPSPPHCAKKTERKFKSVGVCTYICNIKNPVDFIAPMHIKSSNSRPPSRLMFDIERIKHEIPQFSSSPTPNNLPTLSAGNNLMQTSSLFQLQKTTFDELWQVFGHMLLGLLQHQNMNFAARSVSSNNYQQEVQDLMRTMYESMQEKNDEIPIFGRAPPTGQEVLYPQTQKNCTDDLENKTYCETIESFDKPDNHFNIERNSLSPLNKEHENALSNTAFKIPLRCTANDSIKTVSDGNSSELLESNSDNVESRTRRNQIRPHCNVKMKLRKRLEKNHKTKMNNKKTDVYLSTQAIKPTETAVDFLNSLSNSNVERELENPNIETKTIESGKSTEEITQQEKSPESSKIVEKCILNSHIDYSNNKKTNNETTTKEMNSESYATEITQSEYDSEDDSDTGYNIFTNSNDSDNSIESLVIDETTRSMETCQTEGNDATSAHANLNEIKDDTKISNNANNVSPENGLSPISVVQNTNVNNSNEQLTATEILSKGESQAIADISSHVKIANINLTDADRRQIGSESESKTGIKSSGVTVQASVLECSYLRGKYTGKRCKKDDECNNDNAKLAKISTHDDDNPESFSHVNAADESLIIIENNDSYTENANSEEEIEKVNSPLEIKQLPPFSEYEMESPASPLMNADNETSVIKLPREIPLELRVEFVNDGKRYSLLNDLIECYTTSGSSVKQSQSTVNTNLQEAIDLYMKLKHVTAEYAYDLVQRILNKTKDVDCIVAAIVAQRKQATFVTAESVEPKLPNTLNATQSALSLIVIELQQHWPHFVSQLLAKVDSTLFNCQCADKLTLDGALNLTQLYLMLISRHLAMCQSNPARLFIAKCLYYHQMKAMPMIYEVLCYYPTVLPHREERNYDRSDALITVIQHSLMCINYDMDRRDLRTKELLSKMRFEYHFEPFKPDRLDVLRNLMDKLRADKVTHLPYAFAVFCKRQHCAKVTTDVLQAHLIPLANEYYPLLLQSQDYDTRVATLLHCISVVVKPFPLDTDVEPYLCTFERFLHAVPRACVQEAAVQAVIRMQRFGYANCYRALLHYKPAHDLHPQTKAMLKTFLHRKSLHFWKTLRSQSLAADD